MVEGDSDEEVESSAVLDGVAVVGAEVADVLEVESVEGDELLVGKIGKMF